MVDEEDEDDVEDEADEAIKSFSTSGYRVELILADSEDDEYASDVFVSVTPLGDEGEAVRFLPADVWELEDDEDDEEIEDAFDEASSEWTDADVRELLADFGYDAHGQKT